MGFNGVWESIHAVRAWGHYPNENLVRWVNRSISEGHILDLGSGQGASSWFLAREGFQVTAVDGSLSALRKANAWIGREGLKIRSVACCITQLPFADQSFDAVVDVVSSAHNSMSEARKIFAEVARVLKPGGLLFSITPTDTCSRRPFVGLGTVNYMTRQEVEWLLEKTFTCIDLKKLVYQPDQDVFVHHWVVTARVKEKPS